MPEAALETPPREAAWQVLDRITATRKSLLAKGYNLTPTNGKRPFIDGWQNIETTEAEIERWAREYPDALNTGLQTRDTPGVDIDVLDSALAEELQSLLWLMIGDNGQALVRYGRRPKRAVLFQTNEPFDKLSTPFFVSPNGDAHRVEVLCDGQQFIAHGTHPDTGTAYTWEGGEPGTVPRDDLPHLSASVAAEFVAKATEAMRARGWIVQGKQKNDAARKSNGSATGATDFDSIYGGREQKWAAAALADLAAELAGMAPESGRNERLYRAAFRLGTMVARGWIGRATVEGRLLDACKANALENDTGANSVRATLRSGIEGGEAVPHPDLDEQPQNSSPAEQQQATNRPTLALTFFDQLSEAKPKTWIIKNVMARGETSSWIAPPGKGKSSLLTDIAVHAGEGKNWRGYRTKCQCGSLYLALERADLVKRRLIAHKLRDALPNLPIAVSGQVIDLMDRGCVQIILDAIRQTEQHFGCEVGLVIIDTYPKGIAAGGGDENQAKDQNVVLANLRRVLDQAHVHIAGIGHTGKDEGKGERGSNARLADVDVLVQLSGDATKTATVKKANDQPEGELTGFQLEPVDFGADEDGDPFRTFIVAEEIIAGAQIDHRQLSDQQRLALEALAEATLANGRDLSPADGLPYGLKSVTADQWRDELYRTNVLDRDAKNPRARFSELRMRLAVKKLIGVRDDLVWLAQTVPTR